MNIIARTTNLKKKENTDLIHKISSTIINLRFFIILAFIVAGIYCALSIGRVKTNSDLTYFLPANMETHQGIIVMEDEFVAYGTANFMVSNISYDTAQKLADEIADYNHVLTVTFDDTTSHYVNSSALFSVGFDGPPDDPGVVEDFRAIKNRLSIYDLYISSEIDEDLVGTIVSEMVGVVLIAAAVIAAILLFTSRSYFEVVIFAIVFVFAALLNMGTNFWMGEISTITNAIAVILQLALAIDYAIIFSHRYQDEALIYPTTREALTEALAKSIIEISSSSLTTIAGLTALLLMQFGLGPDLGLVLGKGIVCSLLTVFLLMPGLIMLFPKAIKKTAHKSLVPNVEGWGWFLMKSKNCFVWLFALIIPFAIYFSGKVDWSFSTDKVTDLIYSESRYAERKITSTFSEDTMVALLVPAENFEYEKAVLEEIEELPQVKSATGLANIYVDDEYTLTDSFYPRKFADLVDINIEEAQLLFQAYGIKNEEYQAIFNDADNYEVPLIDMFLYLIEKVDQGVVTLDEPTMDTLNGLRRTLNMALDQLRGTNYNRMIIMTNLPAQGEESTQFVETIRDIAESYYGKDTVLVIGTITSTRDLMTSYQSDSVLITILTILFIFAILLFTFRTVAGSVILVFVIQGSIWINFSFSYLLKQYPFFVTDMIVSAIEMGATIDYAIVLMNRYLVFRETMDKKTAMAKAVNHAFPTVLTSGAIMTIAGLLIAYRVSDVYVGHIGLGVGRGAFTSVILVMTVLPQLLVLCDGLIKKTTFNIKLSDEIENIKEAGENE